MAEDKGQTLDEVDRLQQLIDRRGLSWDSFESDVSTFQALSRPEVTDLLDQQKWEVEQARLQAEADAATREVARLHEAMFGKDGIGGAKKAKEAADLEAQNNNLPSGKPQENSPRATAVCSPLTPPKLLPAPNCGVTDPTNRELLPESHFYSGRTA